MMNKSEPVNIEDGTSVLELPSSQDLSNQWTLVAEIQCAMSTPHGVLNMYLQIDSASIKEAENKR